MFTSELLDAHRDALKEDGTIAELLRRVEQLSAAGEAAFAKVAQLQADLDHKVVVQQSWEELEWLRGELEKDSGLQEAGAELCCKESELQQEAELQETQRELGGARAC